MVNPLQQDPSQTAVLRGQYLTVVRQRLSVLATNLHNLIVEEDAFGLAPFEPNILAINDRYRFETEARKIELFREWLQEQVDQGFLIVDSANPWQSEYVESAYKQGVNRAYLQANPQLAEQAAPSIIGGTQSQFIAGAFATDEATKKLQLIFTRNFNLLKGFTEDMSNQLSRILADGIANGIGPRQVGRQIRRQLDISKTRAETIARTEIVKAHAEGQIDAFEKLGVEEVGALVEWLTAGDDRVCPRCAELEGIVIPIKQARGMIPRHPNCRCAWAPVPTKKPTTKSALERAITKSVRAERPKQTKRQAFQKSPWIGADIVPRKKQK